MKQTKDNSELSVAVLNTRASFSGGKKKYAMHSPSWRNMSDEVV